MEWNTVSNTNILVLKNDKRLYAAISPNRMEYYLYKKNEDTAHVKIPEGVSIEEIKQAIENIVKLTME